MALLLFFIDNKEEVVLFCETLRSHKKSQSQGFGIFCDEHSGNFREENWTRVSRDSTASSLELTLSGETIFFAVL